MKNYGIFSENEFKNHAEGIPQLLTPRRASAENGMDSHWILANTIIGTARAVHNRPYNRDRGSAEAIAPQKKPAAISSGLFAKGYLERREVEKRFYGLEIQRLTASAVFL